jgi:predicted acylesterase/phospholipase RssA
MKPFRKHVAIAIDGGGIRGMIVTKALSMLEAEMGLPMHELVQIAVGTSTGSIISAGIGAGISANRLLDLYQELGRKIFPRTLRSQVWPLSRYRYSDVPLKTSLEQFFGVFQMGDFWNHQPPIDVVITTFDLIDNHTRFIKPWKEDYAQWPVAKAVQASCTVPTYFPIVEGRYIDGGVGAYSNPCYLAAYEALICLGWDPSETTLISLGTGREPHTFSPQKAVNLWPWQWLNPILGAFLQSSDDQQVHLVETFFNQIDFRRFQVDLLTPFPMDDTSRPDELIRYGETLGRMILTDNIDAAQKIVPQKMLPNSNK